MNKLSDCFDLLNNFIMIDVDNLPVTGDPQKAKTIFKVFILPIETCLNEAILYLRRTVLVNNKLRVALYVYKLFHLKFTAGI